MPSAANAKSEKPASSEAADNSPIRQIMTIIEHKIRNLEKRKSKLTSYRDLQKAGKELKADQKVAVAKYDEVAQTLEFARDLSKQITSIAISTERESKKQAKREAWVRYASDTNKIREVLLILDCLMQMGANEVRDDFLNGTNGAAKLTLEDLKILDDLYPEVTPKHEVNEEGQPGFHIHTAKAAEHLYGIIDGKPKEIFGTTYAHIKEIITAVHSCGYFDKIESPVVEEEVPAPEEVPQPQEVVEEEPQPPVNEVVYPPAGVMPAPPYGMRPLPPITLQEVEQAYFVQQYPPQQRISDVIGSQNFFFLQESEIDSPVGTPQPVLAQPSPPHQIPTQTFTNQQFVPMPPQPCFPPVLPEHPSYQQHPMAPAPHIPAPAPAPAPARVEPPASESEPRDEWKEARSPEEGERRVQGQGDAQGRFRRYPARARGAPNGYRGRGGFQPRNKDYQPRHYNDNYQPRHKEGYQSRGGDNYCGNGDAADSHHNENGGRDRHSDSQGYQGGFKGRGRGGRLATHAAPRSGPRPPRTHYSSRKQENNE